MVVLSKYALYYFWCDFNCLLTLGVLSAGNFEELLDIQNFLGLVLKKLTILINSEIKYGVCILAGCFGKIWHLEVFGLGTGCNFYEDFHSIYNISKTLAV